MIILKKHNFPKIEGKTLDIGCGGANIISHIYNNVIGIDKNIKELYEDKNNFYKIHLDYAKENFKENYFDAITFYFSLIYMSKEEKFLALKHSYLDLQSTGKLYIWDAPIYENISNTFSVEVSVPFANSLFNPNLYEVSRLNHEQSDLTITKMLNDIGYKKIKIKKKNHFFFIQAEK